MHLTSKFLRTPWPNLEPTSLRKTGHFVRLAPGLLGPNDPKFVRLCITGIIQGPPNLLLLWNPNVGFLLGQQCILVNDWYYGLARATIITWSTFIDIYIDDNSDTTVPISQSYAACQPFKLPSHHTIKARSLLERILPKMSLTIRSRTLLLPRRLGVQYQWRTGSLLAESSW